jgi:hypothetical protein
MGPSAFGEESGHGDAGLDHNRTEETLERDPLRAC